MDRYSEGDYVSAPDETGRVYTGTVRFAHAVGDAPGVAAAFYAGKEIIDENCRMYEVALDKGGDATIGHADLTLIQAAQVAMCYFTITVPGVYIKNGEERLYVRTHMDQLEATSMEPIELLENEEDA